MTFCIENNGYESRNKKIAKTKMHIFVEIIFRFLPKQRTTIAFENLGRDSTPQFVALSLSLFNCEWSIAFLKRRLTRSVSFSFSDLQLHSSHKVAKSVVI